MQQTPKSRLEPQARPLLSPQQPARESVAGPMEVGGPPGPEPTRYGDWERNGRCVDF